MMELILLAVVIILLVAVLVVVLRKSSNGTDSADALQPQLERLERSIREEFRGSREEYVAQSKSNREELNMALKEFKQETNDALFKIGEQNRLLLEQLNKTLDERLVLLIEKNESSNKTSREELAKNLKEFRETFEASVKSFNDLQRQKFDDLEKRQQELVKTTEGKLDEMRKTVDEKLNETLEKRLGESFKQVSDRLEAVHKGLGEMQTLAVSVGDLKKVMSNVKSRGVLGEYQLQNIIEDLLTNEQYEKNVKTKEGSGAIVEFAIKMPHGNNLEKTLWLPIDSKFPKEDYEALVDAYEKGDPEKIEEYRKAFVSGIKRNAKDIKDKYIDPPNTTEYGIMFLPYESLYSEVLRVPGLFEQLQKEYKITITGPTTLSALLNSLQMGFRTLAIEKRSSEVWDLLGAVKTEFGKFGTIIEKTRDKLVAATKELDNTGVRTRSIERKLRQVQELPASDSSKILDAADEDTQETES
jgi:DNA recombination protein RmuC